MADEPNSDPKGQQDPQDNPQNPPSNAGDGQGNTADDLPEKFKGKTAAEIAKAYTELEGKFGENSKEVGEAREHLQQWESLGKVIRSNPELQKQIEKEISRLAGGGDDDPKPNNDDPNKNGQASQDDTRVAVENEIIGRFEGKYGIDSLPAEKRKELNTKIGLELSDMLDPSGKKTYREILDSISLERLPKYLDKAYRLATIGDEAETARVNALLENRRNIEASFSSMPATGGGNSETLSEAERAAAKKLGISEEDYLREKKKLEEENK